MGEELYGELTTGRFRAPLPRFRARRSQTPAAVPRAEVARNGANTSFVIGSCRPRRTAKRSWPIPSTCRASPTACIRASRAARAVAPEGETRAERISRRSQLEALAGSSGGARSAAGARSRASTAGRLVPSKPARPGDRAASSASRSSPMRPRAPRARHRGRLRAQWSETKAKERAAVLERAAELIEADRGELVARCVAETGKTIPDSLAEVREAVDLLRSYAAEAKRVLATPTALPGPTGERNALELVGRGVFFCVSPWNFPLAIFTGQVAAALAAGNTVIAKPAEQGTLVAARAVALLERAGIPAGALQFLPGDGRALGRALLGDARVAGSRSRLRGDGARDQCGAREARGPLATLSAELSRFERHDRRQLGAAEQLCATRSRLRSQRGSRCSALRIAVPAGAHRRDILRMLCGAVDDSWSAIRSGFRPTSSVIDDDARSVLTRYIAEHESAVVHRRSLGRACARLFVAHRHRCRALGAHARGVRPVLPSCATSAAARRARRRDQRARLRLTLACTRASTRREGRRAARAGRQRLLNRNMIGAVVGVQPFGVHGLSGTGPKRAGRITFHVSRRSVRLRQHGGVGGNATLLRSTRSRLQEGGYRFISLYRGWVFIRDFGQTRSRRPKVQPRRDRRPRAASSRVATVGTGFC